MEADTEIAFSLKGHGNAEYDTEISKTAAGSGSTIFSQY